MHLGSIAETLARSDRAKAQIARTGRSPSGLLWTANEDETLRRLYPDYHALCKVLKQRSYDAIKKRVVVLGIAQARHRWTAAEISRLRRLYPKQTRDELLVSFPGLRWPQIRRMANYKGFTMIRRPYAPTGITVIDAIRARAFDLNLTMVDLDAMAKTGNYFRSSRWRTYGISKRSVCRAIDALDGDVMPIWR
jgi:hypothetical protein